MSLQKFQTHFYNEYNELTQLIDSLSNAIGTESETISNRIEILQKYFTENTSFIPNFEVRKAQEHLSKLNRLAQEKRENLMPKKKFAFKSKQNLTSLDNKIESEATLKSAADASKAPADSAQMINLNVECSCNLKDLNDSNVIKNESEINGKDVGIVNVKNSVIQIFGYPSVLHINGIESCTILCGPIIGSCFINNCKNCKLALACHQLRIHETSNSQFYIHVGSRAIIENTKHVTFAPYSWTYPGLDGHFLASNLKSGEFNWTSIDDFNWLNQTQKSPNWSFLNPSDQIKWESDSNGEIKTN